MDLYRMYYVDHRPLSSIIAKSGLSRTTIYRRMRTFAASNPEKATEMRNQGKDLTLEDYKSELSRLQAELRREKLRADFYEEMVAFGKEVYGIDLKKAGTK